MAWSLIQSTTGTTSASFGSSVPIGHLLIASVGYDFTAPTAVSDSVNGAYTLLADSTPFTHVSIQMWVVTATTAGTPTITVTGGTPNTLTIMEFSPGGVNDAVYVANFGYGPTCSVSCNAASAGDLVVTSIAAQYNYETPDISYAEFANFQGARSVVADSGWKIASASGSQSCLWTVNGGTSSYTAAAIATFKPSGGGASSSWLTVNTNNFLRGLKH